MCRAPNVIAYFYLKVSACFMLFCTSSARLSNWAPEGPSERHLSPVWPGLGRLASSIFQGRQINFSQNSCLLLFWWVCRPTVATKWFIFYTYTHATLFIHIYIHVSYVYDKAHCKCWHVDAALMSFACLSVLWPDCCSSTFFLMLCSLYRQAFDCVCSLWAVRWWLLFLSLIALAWQRL